MKSLQTLYTSTRRPIDLYAFFGLSLSRTARLATQAIRRTHTHLPTLLQQALWTSLDVLNSIPTSHNTQEDCLSSPYLFMNTEKNTPGGTNPRNSAQTPNFEEAERLWTEMKLEQALKVFESLLDDDPTGWALYTCGMLLCGGHYYSLTSTFPDLAHEYFCEAHPKLLEATSEPNPDPKLFVALGTMSLYGLGTHVDHNKGMEFLTRAADAGNAYAAYLLWQIKHPEAKKYFSQALKSGTIAPVHHLYAMGIFDGKPELPGTIEDVVTHLRRAAELGLDTSANFLGLMYETGEAIPRDDREAAKLYKLAADRGNRNGLLKYGRMLSEGRGVPMDIEEARRLFSPAAEKGGDSLAHAMLGALFMQGDRPNMGEAFRHYTLAVASSSLPPGDLHTKLGLWAESGIGIPKNLREAVQNYKLAADEEEGEAQANLGWLLFEGGEGVDGNLRKAKQLLEMAVEKGIPRAHEKLARLSGMEYVRDMDLQEARELYTAAMELGDTSHEKILSEISAVSEKGGNYIIKVPKAEALKVAKQVVDGGRPEGLFTLGWCYETGLGAHKDIRAAADLFRRAAEAGHLRAAFYLGLRLEEGAEGIPRSPEEAVAFLVKAAEGGLAVAQYRLAVRCYEGTVSGGHESAVRLLQHAAGQGHVPSIFKLAEILSQNPGTRETAKNLFTRVAEFGMTSAKVRLAVLLMQEDSPSPRLATKKIRSLFDEAAREGHAYAELMLSSYLRQGKGGPREVQDANEWTKRASERGYIPAMRAWGGILIGKKDLKGAEQVFLELAQKGLPDAQAQLGLMMMKRKGEGRQEQQDREKGKAYLRLAASQGDSFAMLHLGMMMMEGDQRDPEEGVRLLKGAAEKGMSEAQFQLGMMYRKGGEGVWKDDREAKKYLEEAAHGRNLAAVAELARLYSEAGSRDKKKGEIYARLVQKNTKRMTSILEGAPSQE
jgi:TPR repeat protein